jgi:hypothetical protein
VRNFALKSVIFSSSIFCCYIKLITASLFQTVQQRISALFIDQMIPKFIPLGVCSITQTTGPCGGDERVVAFDADDGIGRFGSPAGGPNSVEANYPDLLTTAAKLAADWYGRTNIYPVHGTIVVKDSVLAEHPWAAKSHHDAFSNVKNEWLARPIDGPIEDAAHKCYVVRQKFVGSHPLPYCMKANLAPTRTLEDTIFKQDLTPRHMSVEELFVDPETVLMKRSAIVVRKT